jgi:hypothetical protein
LSEADSDLLGGMYTDGLSAYQAHRSFAITVLEKTAAHETRHGQSIVQTQKSREFPGCRIIHTF